MENLLRRIELAGIPAHSPIEQRWSSGSSSLMSPAHGNENDLFSWVGIIMYLPAENIPLREAVTERFRGEYCNLLKTVGLPVNAASHWAKLEPPHTVWQILDMHFTLNSQFPLAKFNEVRGMWDPHNILTSPAMTRVLGLPTVPKQK